MAAAVFMIKVTRFIITQTHTHTQTILTCQCHTNQFCILKKKGRSQDTVQFRVIAGLSDWTPVLCINLYKKISNVADYPFHSLILSVN